MLRSLSFFFIALLSPALLANPAAEIASRVQPPLRSVYEARQFAPLWLDGNKPTTRATQALDMIGQAAFDGLRSADYSLTTLQQSLSALQQQNSSDAAQLATFDLALSKALAQFASDLYLGRVDPRSLSIAIDTSEKRAAFAQHLQAVLTTNDLTGAIATLRPTFPPYADLRRLLVQYRALAEQYPIAPTLPPLPGKKLTPTESWAGTPALAAWLKTLGFLPENANVTTLYDGAVVEGVKQFQQQHGQIPDGVLGKQTYDNLRITIPDRVKQIEFSMERLRWLDDNTLRKRFLLINVPQFTLWAYAPDTNGQAKSVLQMPVVVGKARKNQTPLMQKTLSSIVFTPYWNVPRSIIVKEILPKLDENPFYLAHENMELVGSNGSLGSAVNDAEYDGIARGAYRIRQRPGAGNALGTLKFVFPNDDAIYMHDTPSKSFFAKERRDLSHGCVRLGNPMALALFVLEPQGGWDEARVKQMIANSRDRHHPLSEQMPVLLIYLTANVDSAGKAIFLNDIYAQDDKLAAALAKRPTETIAQNYPAQVSSN